MEINESETIDTVAQDVTKIVSHANQENNNKPKIGTGLLDLQVGAGILNRPIPLAGPPAASRTADISMIKPRREMEAFEAIQVKENYAVEHEQDPSLGTTPAESTTATKAPPPPPPPPAPYTAHQKEDQSAPIPVQIGAIR